jgi:hypothetical protein
MEFVLLFELQIITIASIILCRILGYSGVLRCVALVKADVSKERIASIIIHRSVLRLLVTANVVHSSTILVNLKMEPVHSSETSVFTRPTRRMKSYIAISGWAL